MRHEHDGHGRVNPEVYLMHLIQRPYDHHMHTRPHQSEMLFSAQMQSCHFRTIYIYLRNSDGKPSLDPTGIAAIWPVSATAAAVLVSPLQFARNRRKQPITQIFRSCRQRAAFRRHRSRRLLDAGNLAAAFLRRSCLASMQFFGSRRSCSSARFLHHLTL